MSSPHHSSALTSTGFAYTQPYCLDVQSNRTLRLSYCVPPSIKTIIGGTGISTCYPSPTPVGLSLGPDLPRADEPSSGNLSPLVDGILTRLSLLTPAFTLQALHMSLRSCFNALRTLSYHCPKDNPQLR